MSLVIILPSGEELPCNTMPQLHEAAQRLHDAGIRSAPVWSGEHPDRVMSRLMVYASDTRPKDGAGTL